MKLFSIHIWFRLLKRRPQRAISHGGVLRSPPAVAKSVAVVAVAVVVERASGEGAGVGGGGVGGHGDGRVEPAVDAAVADVDGGAGGEAAVEDAAAVVDGVDGVDGLLDVGGGGLVEVGEVADVGLGGVVGGVVADGEADVAAGAVEEVPQGVY